MYQEKSRDPNLPPSADPAPMPNPEHTRVTPAADEAPFEAPDNNELSSYEDIEPEVNLVDAPSSSHVASYAVAPRHLPTAALSSPIASPRPKMPSVPPLSLPSLTSPLSTSLSPARQTPSPKISALDLTKLQSQSALINTLKAWLKTVADAFNDRSFTDRLGYKRAANGELLADGGFIVAHRLFISNYQQYRLLNERNIFFIEELESTDLQSYVQKFNVLFFGKETNKLALQRAAAIIGLLRLLIKNIDDYRNKAHGEKKKKDAKSFDKKTNKLEKQLTLIHNQWSSNANDRSVFFQEYIDKFKLNSLVSDNDKLTLNEFVRTIDKCSHEMNNITELAQRGKNAVFFKETYLISASNDITDITDPRQLLTRASIVAGILLARRDYAINTPLYDHQKPYFDALNKFCEGITAKKVTDEFIVKVAQALIERKIYFSKHLHHQSLRATGTKIEKFTTALYDPQLDRDELVERFINDDELSFSDASTFFGPLRNGVDEAQYALESPPKIQRTMEPTLEAPVIPTKKPSSITRLLGGFFSVTKPPVSATTHVTNPLLSRALPSHSLATRAQTVHTAASAAPTPVKAVHHATELALATPIDVIAQQVTDTAALPQTPAEPAPVRQDDIDTTIQPLTGPKP